MYEYNGPYKKTFEYCFDLWSEKYVKFFSMHPVHPVTKLSWDWSRISSNPNVTWNSYKKHPELPWVWENINNNPNIGWDLVQQHPEECWDINVMLHHPTVTCEAIESLEKYQPEININYFSLSHNPNITLNFVLNRLDKIWYWDALSRYLKLHKQDIIEHHHNINWSVYCLNCNSSFSVEDIIQLHRYCFQDSPYSGIIYNPNVKWEDITNPSYSFIRWDWTFVSFHQSITMEIITSNLDKPWNWRFVSINPNLTWEFIKENHERFQFDWNEITKHPCITWEIITENPGFPWNIDQFAYSPNSALRLLDSNMDSLPSTLKGVEIYKSFDKERDRYITKLQSIYYILYFKHHLVYNRGSSLMVYFSSIDLLTELFSYL